MRILILGGDGYLGWPTSMHFSRRGHEVHALDDYLRRRAHTEAGTDSLTPILASLPARAKAWRDVTGLEIGVSEGDLLDWEVVERVFREFQPEAIVHYGEMPSAPYSMIDREHAAFTQTNNVIGTLNVLFAMAELAPDAHLVKLGTMGEYGTPNIDIEEGFITIHHKGRSDTLPFPKMPGSIYHLSKVHDSHNIQFACRTWGLRSTDLNQGVVYGIETDETTLDPRLATRFDYDEVFGTALNRFCLAAYGLPVEVRHLDNPRVESEEHYYNPAHTKLLDLGLDPHLLSETLIESMFSAIERHKDRVILDHIMPSTRWRPPARERTPR